MGISSRGGCLWSTDKDYLKLFSISAHCVNSVSGLALYFGYGLALDFGLDLMQKHSVTSLPYPASSLI